MKHPARIITFTSAYGDSPRRWRCETYRRQMRPRVWRRPIVRVAQVEWPLSFCKDRPGDRALRSAKAESAGCAPTRLQAAGQSPGEQTAAASPSNEFV